jgi:hypothetical protein
LLKCAKADEDFFKNIVTGDERWAFIYDPETKQVITVTNIFMTMTQESMPSLMQDKSDAYGFF